MFCLLYMFAELRDWWRQSTQLFAFEHFEHFCRMLNDSSQKSVLHRKSFVQQVTQALVAPIVWCGGSHRLIARPSIIDKQQLRNFLHITFRLNRNLCVLTVWQFFLFSFRDDDQWKFQEVLTDLKMLRDNFESCVTDIAKSSERTPHHGMFMFQSFQLDHFFYCSIQFKIIGYNQQRFVQLNEKLKLYKRMQMEQWGLEKAQ